MKDWIIISWYDSGYCYSISIDGKVMRRNEIEDIEDYKKEDIESIRVYIDIRDMYDEYDVDGIKKIQTKYHKNVLVCEDGGIEFYEL